MTDHRNDDDNNSEEKEESFAALLDAYSPGTEDAVRIGDKIRGKIIAIGKDSVFVDTGTKVDGVVDKVELMDKDQQLEVEEGDMLELYVVALTDDEIRLSKALSGIGGLQMLKEAYEKAVPVEGRISETCKGGFRVDVLQRKAFCPISQVDINYVEDPWDTADQHFQQGDKILGKVTRCANFGAFVEVAPGIEGLVHISEMSYTKRILNPEDVVSAGETVSVLIKELDMEKRRMSLSIRDAEGDPWVDVAGKYTIGQSLTAVLEKKEKFGYFINLEPGITGLLPKSILGKFQRSSEFEKLKEGDPIPVIIEAIDTGERKITLRPGNTEDEQNWQEFSGDTGSSMGALGEKLQQAMSQKKTD
jgi:small subunit ribosomal protein S1